uniref:Uncharacterized protein n=1 Tax=Anthurium amnicola TaxID=1678845 RepID=A0A1D1XXJ6_9ARAE
MKFAVVAALASSAAAGVTVRDAAAVQAILTSIQSATEKVDTAAKAYNGGTPTDVYSAASDLTSAITSGESKVKASGPLQAADAITLQTPVKDLTTVSQTLVKDLIAKRSLVEEAGQCSEALSNVNSVYSAGTDLVNAVISQVQGGAAIQSVAAQLASPLTVVLKSATEAFGTASCVDKAGGSGGSSATSSSAAAATTSAAASSSSKAAATSSTGGYAPPPASTSAAAATTTPSGPASTPTAHPASAALIAPAGIMALALAVFAL